MNPECEDCTRLNAKAARSLIASSRRPPVYSLLLPETKMSFTARPIQASGTGVLTPAIPS